MIRNISLAWPACLALILTATSAHALDTSRDDVRSFIDDMSKRHSFQRPFLETALTDSATQQKIIEAMSRPAEKTKAWHEYRAIFITPERIAAGADFWNERGEQLDRIAAQTGVPAEIIAAIVGVETYFGRITGRYRVIDALATLAFDYPPRSKFFRSELEQFFLLTREEQLSITDVVGSYAGAMGPPQFIPSSYRAYAVDGDGDGRRDLLTNWDDVLASVANYFVAHKWRSGEPVFARGSVAGDRPAPESRNELNWDDTLATLSARGIRIDDAADPAAKAALFVLEGETSPEYWVGFHNAYVITRYNRSIMYALAVFQLSQALADVRPVSQTAASAP